MYIILQRILYLFRRYGFCEEDNPTLWRQFECAHKKEEFKDEITMEAAKEYMKLCYGDGILKEAEQQKIIEFYYKLLMYAKAQSRRISYYMLLFHLSRIKMTTSSSEQNSYAKKRKA